MKIHLHIKSNQTFRLTAEIFVLEDMKKLIINPILALNNWKEVNMPNDIDITMSITINNYLHP